VKRFRAVIRGRVQGVGFRASTFEAARALGLAGWVRNLPDGAVEVEAEGDEARLHELELFLRQGPRMSRVTGADFCWETDGRGFTTFEIK
jgi:acylphosphatase